jgi:hypothetical protein
MWRMNFGEERKGENIPREMGMTMDVSHLQIREASEKGKRKEKRKKKKREKKRITCITSG